MEFGAAHCSHSLAVAHCGAPRAEPSVHFMPALGSRDGLDPGATGSRPGHIVELAQSCRWNVEERG